MNWRIFAVAVVAVSIVKTWAFEKIALVDNMDFSSFFDIERPGGNKQIFDYVGTLGATMQLWRGQAGGMLRYPSKIEYGGTPSVEVPIDKRRIPANFMTTGWLKCDDFGYDQMQEAVDCCHKTGVKFGVHWSTEESHGATWCLGPWNLNHPEFWCRRKGGAPWPGRASLAWAEVLEHKMAIARELNAYLPKMVYVDFYRAYGAEAQWEYVAPVIDEWRRRYGCEPPDDWHDRRWIMLVKEFNHRFVRELHKAMPNTELVLAVDRLRLDYDWMLENRSIDWRELVKEGAVDAIGVMCVLPDWGDPWTSTRKIYSHVMDVCRDKVKVYFPVNAYSGQVRPGLYEFAKRTGVKPQAAAKQLLDLAVEFGAAGVTLECVDYQNYAPDVVKVIHDYKTDSCK